MDGALSNAENRRPHILIVYTGGTIGMIENDESGALEPFDFDHLIDNVPKIKRLDYDIDNVQFEVPLDSSAMTPDHWVEIVKVIAEITTITMASLCFTAPIPWLIPLPP